MSKPPQIVGFRHTRREKQQRNPAGRLGLTVGILASLAVMLGLLAVLYAYVEFTAGLPSLESIPTRLEPPDGVWLRPTRLYDRSGEHVILTLEDPGTAGRRYLYVSVEAESGVSFPQSLVNATVAAIDPSFWDNPGYSWQGIQEGTHNTLAQRFVLELLLSGEPASLRRNMRERLLAGQLVSRYGQARVLEWYLNSARYGYLVYGADAAARVYFGKSAQDLSNAEAAWLCAVAETPAISSMAASPGVIERQRQIIAEMLIQGMITPDEARQANDQELAFRVSSQPDVAVQAFADLVLEQVRLALPAVQFERGGLRIVTTLDYDLQLQAQCALETHLTRLQGQPETVLTTEGTACEAARLLTTLPAIENQNLEGIAGNIVVLAPGSGQVLALVGETQAGLDPAHRPGHPAGTLLTPFIYLSAFVRGFSPATLIWDVPEVSQSSEIVPPASGLDELAELDLIYHGPVRLRTALANDYLGPAAQLYERIGAGNIWQTSRQFGMTSLSQVQTAPGSFIDYVSTDVTLLESVHAFSVLSNLGLQTGQNLYGDSPSGESESLSPVALLSIQDHTGQTLLDWSQPEQRPIVSPQLAYLVTHVLTDETARWPSLNHPNPLEIGRPAGARLGASIDGSQSWVVGFVPQLTVGVWLGNVEDNDQVVPALTAAVLWNAVIKYASQDLPVEGWDAPAGVTSLPVCDPSGLLPTNTCPVVVNEVFMAGNEPTQLDNLYQVLRINRETGQLATVFTPPELVDSRVYLVLPASAEPWAEQAGLPIPPAGYDPIYLPAAASPDVRLEAPAMFEHVHGQVELYGSATGDGFSYFRLQVGQGLNPTQWLLLGEDEHQPVVDGLLGTWDTQGLQGLYVIQLSVVRTDQRVESFILQVTVDNVPPQVEIMDPTDAEMLTPDESGNVLLQADASDDLVLERLEFYLDGELILTLWQPPYAAMWSATPGEHTLLVRAFDRAGNSSEQSVTFIIER